MNVKEEKRCRVCNGFLDVVLDLGEIYPSGFLKLEEAPEDKAPLNLAECRKCGLVQLKHTVDLDSMYRQYWYTSSLNKSMISSLQDIVKEIEEKIPLKENDTVLDIGCNDGTLLGLYSRNDIIKVGYDPSENIKKTCDFLFVNDYFNTNSWVHDKAKVVTAIAMFYDLPNPIKFVNDVQKILHRDGIFVVQFTDLVSMFRVKAFDNICHEHLEYYKLSDIHNIFTSCGLEIIDVSYNKVNGGSLRVTAAHWGRYLRSRAVNLCLKAEQEILQQHNLQSFRNAINETKMKIGQFLEWAKQRGEEVHLMGASTKGNTLLQICGVTGDLVPYAAEVNKEKFGLSTAGSNIKIISEEESLVMNPKYYLVPIWHFKDSLLSNSKIQSYLNSGGALVFPLPNFRVVLVGENKEIKEIEL